MKKIRKILALVLALSVMLALSVGVFADGDEASETPAAATTAYSITVNVPTGSNLSIAGNTYYAYRLFDATYSGDNVAYTVNANFKDFTYTVGETSYSGDTLIAYLATLEKDSEALDAFAKAALAYITEKSIAPSGSVEASSDSATINVDAAGYYLVTGTATAEDNQTVTAACALTTAKPTASITLKADAPTVEKKIVEGSSDVEANDASIGDSVNYKITSKVPDMQGYDSYWFVMEDTLSKGLTYNEDIKITVNGMELTKDTDYTVATSEIKDNDNNVTGTKIEIVLKNFIQYKDKSGKDIVVTYSATVNQDAELDPTVGNPNTVKLIYSNNPNHNYGGDKWTGDDKPTDVVGETPEQVVKTYVTGIKLTKVDSSTPAKSLTGAKFQISGTSLKVVLINKEVYKVSEDGTYYMLKGGTFTETASTTETADKYDSTTTKYVKVTEVTKDTVATEINATGYVNEDGVLTFEGLGEGTYTITELVAPNGYNLLKDPITITIEATKVDTSGCTWEVKKGEEALTADTDHLYAFNVVNNAGTELPSTGGIGTTLFYVIGGLLVVCAGVILVTRKRMSKEG